MYEPFVILWRAHVSTSTRVARTCFGRIRVHHPNALVLIFRDGDVDLSYVDERCCMVRELCPDDLTAWLYFSSHERFGAGLLLHDSIFVGSRPFPPFTRDQFLWLENPDHPDVSFRVEPSNEIITFQKPLGLMGYFRRTGVQGMPNDTQAFIFRMIRKGTGFTFGCEPCDVKEEGCLDALVQVDVPVYCRIV